MATVTTPRLSARFVDDHRNRSELPGAEAARNGQGVTLTLTLGELHDLASDADHYADEAYGRELRDGGMHDLHRSACKVVEQLQRAGLWELAWSDEAAATYHVEAAAAAEAQRDEQAELRNYLRQLLADGK